MTDEPEFRWRDCPKYAWNFICIAFLRLQTRWAKFRLSRTQRKLERSDRVLAQRVAHLSREERWKFYADMDAEIDQVTQKLEAKRAAGKAPVKDARDAERDNER